MRCKLHGLNSMIPLNFCVPSEMPCASTSLISRPDTACHCRGLPTYGSGGSTYRTYCQNAVLAMPLGAKIIRYLLNGPPGIVIPSLSLHSAPCQLTSIRGLRRLLNRPFGFRFARSGPLLFRFVSSGAQGGFQVQLSEFQERLTLQRLPNVPPTRLLCL